MHNPNGLRTVCLITPSLLLLMPLSVLAFVLERISQAFLAVHTSRYIYGDLYFNDWGLGDGSARAHVNYGPTGAIIGISIMTLIVSGISACGTWELRRIEGTPRHQRAWSWAVVLANFAITVASIAVLAWYSALQKSEAWSSVDDFSSGRTFTRETWFCQINKFRSDQDDWAAPACGIAQAARYVLIPLALSSALCIVAAWILIQDRGSFSWLRGGRGRYGGFDNLYEMQAQHRPVFPKNGAAVGTVPIGRPAPIH
ncbi:hypothetical protein BDV96DRAFT_568218 [Lophiotrema nucula]|uniref:Uncharacterized protein n=1 Tax=Lophiotrema nucula TaxID=690887 RepID=A0A6A5ZKJ1_9PLEO|nr:hypothetical protein BDV96DRAFT_568218 [Lophiotrema nucula]